jgi:hypothetical protein
MPVFGLTKLAALAVLSALAGITPELAPPEPPQAARANVRKPQAATLRTIDTARFVI